MKRKLLAILLSVLLLAACVPLGAVSVTAEVTSGTTGDCTWVLEDGHLTISGEGAMGNYYYWDSATSAPWGWDIASLTIEEGVTSIGVQAFYYSTLLTSVTIPSSVTTIEGEAFSLCYALTSIVLPKSITDIGFSAFNSCNALSDVYYGGSEEDRANIAIDGANDSLLDATWHYNYKPETEVTYGDSNGDGRINNKDLGLLQQYLAGWDVELNLDACDVNKDGRVNNRDLGLLQQYLADWDVELG